MKRFLSWIGRIIYQRKEYVYLFSLPFDVEKDDLRTEMIKFINKDILPKSIDYTDFYTDTELGLTYFIFGSYKSNPFFIPLFYEIFANIKRKNIDKFSYSYKKLIFKKIEVLKFTVKCYGKR